MGNKWYIRILILFVVLFALWSIRLPEENVVKDQMGAKLNGRSNSPAEPAILHSKPIRTSSKTVDGLDPRSNGLKRLDKAVAFLVHTEGLIQEIPESQSNVRNEAKALGRLLFADDWAVLRLEYPKLPKDLGETLYKSVMESVGTSNKIDVVDWIRTHLEGVLLEDVLQSQSADNAVAMNRHYQWILEDGRRPDLMEVVRALAGELDSSTLMGSPMLMDLWGYGFSRAEAQDWEKQRLDTSLPTDFPRTAEERALFNQPSPKQVQAASEERRWSQSLHHQVFSWRLGQLYGVENPARILEIVEKIQFKDPHHFGWPVP